MPVSDRLLESIVGATGFFFSLTNVTVTESPNQVNPSSELYSGNCELVSGE